MQHGTVHHISAYRSTAGWLIGLTIFLHLHISYLIDADLCRHGGEGSVVVLCRAATQYVLLRKAEGANRLRRSI